MKKITAIVPFAACLLMAACADNDAALNPLNEVEAQLSSAASELRIVEPSSGSIMPAGRTFTLQAEQQVRGGPLQGRAQLQSSVDGVVWTQVGSDLPWSAQDLYVTVQDFTLSQRGRVQLRLSVYDVSPDAPFLQSGAISVVCLGQVEMMVADLDR